MSDELSITMGKQTIVYAALAVAFFVAGFSARSIAGWGPRADRAVEQSVADAPAPAGAPSALPAPTPAVRGVSADDDPWTGGENAAVEIIEFSDFECPFCRRAVPTVKQVLSEYGNNVKVVYRDFPLNFHTNAQKAAEAAECADEQNKFWQYHDRLFETGELDVASLKQHAATLGLDTAAFDDCLDNSRMADEVRRDFADGQAAGVSGTPTFFINGKKLVGAQPFEAFKQAIDRELVK